MNRKFARKFALIMLFMALASATASAQWYRQQDFGYGPSEIDIALGTGALGIVNNSMAQLQLDSILWNYGQRGWYHPGLGYGQLANYGGGGYYFGVPGQNVAYGPYDQYGRPAGPFMIIGELALGAGAVTGVLSQNAKLGGLVAGGVAGGGLIIKAIYDLKHRRAVQAATADLRRQQAGQQGGTVNVVLNESAVPPQVQPGAAVAAPIPQGRTIMQPQLPISSFGGPSRFERYVYNHTGAETELCKDRCNGNNRQALLGPNDRWPIPPDWLTSDRIFARTRTTNDFGGFDVSEAVVRATTDLNDFEVVMSPRGLAAK